MLSHNVTGLLIPAASPPMIPRDKMENIRCEPPPLPRVVLHVDLDAFFVQVERSLNPTLIGKPMAIQQHADVIAVSYEARAMGVTKHMPTNTIRQRFPSVKLVHVETMGLQNEKVSYRNYRKAARSIFTLIRAFCPPEDGASDTHGGGSCGKFQKTSVDEAFLEPGRRILMAELSLSKRSESVAGTSVVGPATGKEDTDGSKRFRGGNFIRNPGCVSKSSPDGAGTVIVNTTSTDGGDGGRKGLLATPKKPSGLWGGESGESAASESQGGVGSEETRPWDVAVGDDSPKDAWGRQRAGGGVGRHGKAHQQQEEEEEEQEEDRWLEAGGLLGKRIQQTLSDVLDYDCSVGVARNKFLAKLATNLAKPKGVRVLFRREIASLLAGTPATKIPGCGAGSVASRHFTSWGVKHVGDIRRLEARELRERLGKKLGAKVYDRCRGVDNDPVEPDPVPNKISSQTSLVPLIKPAYCLGKPGEKLMPVFPWEVERLRPFLVTLVDDLIDRMAEEMADRSRRPTKLCVEHHLHQRGSKSQTFVLPPPASAPSPPTAGSFGKQRQSLDKSQPQRQSGEPPRSGSPADNVGLIPSAATLVELALTPFKSYGRRGAIGGRAENGDNPAGELPPVVKLNVSLLGLESVGVEGPVAVPPGQRTLRDMRWLGRGSIIPDSTSKILPDDGTSIRRGQPSVGGILDDETAATALVLCSPMASVPQSSSASSPVGNISRPAETKRDGHEEDVRNREPQPVAEGSSILVRCPRCRACLPLGEAWDGHREEHVALDVKHEKTGVKYGRSISPSPTTGLSSSTFPLSGRETSSPHSARKSRPIIRLQQRQRLPQRKESFDTDGGRECNSGTSSAKRPQFGQSVTRKRPKQAGEYAGQLSDSAGGRNEKPARLSDLLRLAVTPAQAADVLRGRGLLRSDEQTRFAHVRLGRGSQETLHE